MARAGKRVRKACSVTLFPKFLRFYAFGRTTSLRLYGRRGVHGIINRANAESVPNAFIDEQTADIDEQAADIHEEAVDIDVQEPFVAPRFDDTRLIVEELKMGFVRLHHIKAGIGSKVSVKCEYKSESGESLGNVNRDLVLGSSEVMTGLHEGVCGMSIGNKRRLHIPSSLQFDGRAVCEVPLCSAGREGAQARRHTICTWPPAYLDYSFE